MANLKVNNYHILRFTVNKDEYWDFFVNRDNYGYYGFDSDGLYDKCVITNMDLAHADCDDSGWIYSDYQYKWEDALSVGYTLYNITYTGVDNGLFTFRKDRIANKDFLKIFQMNKLEVPQDDFRLRLHAVSGSTLQYDYPLHAENGYIKFNGGFYQGFFKTECDKYQVFPTHFEDGDNYYFEFTLNRCDLEAESDKTLNDKYPDNKGIFFYMGTRAENKWIYLYDKDDVDGLEECYQLGMDDFVEDGGIDKKDHIIGNFYDLDPEFYEDPPIDIDDYINFNYYDENLYAMDPCDWDEMFDYVEVNRERPIKTIDEDNEHVTLGWCCNEEEEKEHEVLRPWFVGCDCSIRYKKKKEPKEENVDLGFLSGCIPFGEGDYIDGWDGLEEWTDWTDYAEPEMDITDFEYYTDNGFNLGEAHWYYFYTENKYLMFDRTKSGKTIRNWVDGTQYMYCGRKSNFKGNLFILMNRTKTGYTVHNIDELRDENANYYNPYKDLYNNALAFRVTDKGEIGYRLLTVDCEKEGRDKTAIIEGYSFEDVIPECEWVTVTIRTIFLVGGKMKFMFYVNGMLKYISKELPRIDLRELHGDPYEKQEGVPYNMSIGGGTQGLAETIQYNYMLNPTRVYPLEKYFAGSFIGYMRTFRVYNCFMEPMFMQHNFEYEKKLFENDKYANITIDNNN